MTGTPARRYRHAGWGGRDAGIVLGLVGTSLLVWAQINAVWADRRMSAGQTEAQQARGFQRVNVSFDQPEEGTADDDGVSRRQGEGIAGANHQMGGRL